MSYVLDLDVVRYACTCGLLKPISQLYFCRYCRKLRCHFCVCQEVDSLFCGKCYENLPSTEARLKKNRCGICYICPICQQDLSTRIAYKSAPNSEDPKSTPRKLYYLTCQFCRWTSRDVGIPDQTTATGNWPERENVHANRLQDILDMSRSVVLMGIQQRERMKKKPKVKFVSYTERTGLTAAALRKRIGLPEEIHSPLSKSVKVKDVPPAVATADVEPLPDDIFTTPVNLFNLTTIDQRLLQPDSQPNTVDKLFPVHKYLVIKRSLRCRSCEHNVCKPEYNPNSYKFKIQLFAYFHIPEVRIVTVQPLRAGKEAELILRITNPTQHETTVSFLPVDCEDPLEVIEVPLTTGTHFQSDDKSITQSQSLLQLSSRQPCLVIEPRPVDLSIIKANIVIPKNMVILPARDDSAEFDDTNEPHNYQDDPKFVIWRKSNKTYVRFMVTPQENLALNSEVITAFKMQHTYTTLISMKTEMANSPKYNHRVNIFLTLGKIVGDN